MKGTELHRLRNDLGLSIAEAARQVEVSERTWLRWERDTKPIPQGAIKLLRLLNKRGEGIDVEVVTLARKVEEIEMEVVTLARKAEEIDVEVVSANLPFGSGTLNAPQVSSPLQRLDGAGLRALRLKLGLSAAEAARRLEVSLRSYQRWENGDRPIPQNIGRLLKKLGG